MKVKLEVQKEGVWSRVGGGGGEWGYKGHIHEERCFTCEYIIIIKSQGEITYKKKSNEPPTLTKKERD